MHIVSCQDCLVFVSYAPSWVARKLVEGVLKMLTTKLTRYSLRIITCIDIFFKRTPLSISFSLTRVTKLIDEGDDIDGDYLDFAEVFASLNHNMVSFQLVTNGFNPNGIGWIHNFLSNLKFVVKIDGVRSSPGDACSGVLQGSVIRLSEYSMELGISVGYAYKGREVLRNKSKKKRKVTTL